MTTPVHTRPTHRIAGPRPTRPHRVVSPGRVRGGATSCQVAAPAPAPGPGLLVKLKLAVVAVLAVAGTAVAVGGFIDQAQVDPHVEVVAGDPGWAHVTGG